MGLGSCAPSWAITIFLGSSIRRLVCFPVSSFLGLFGTVGALGAVKFPLGFQRLFSGSWGSFEAEFVAPLAFLPACSETDALQCVCYCQPSVMCNKCEATNNFISGLQCSCKNCQSKQRTAPRDRRTYLQPLGKYSQRSPSGGSMSSPGSGSRS